MFRRKKSPLRYYLYVSDAKLDMLFEQIEPAHRRRISVEAKIDLKLASLTLGQATPSSAARMAKLQVVERYIDNHHQVGTVGSPGGEYFRGSMLMQWGWLSHGFDPESPTDGRDTVFFRGQQGPHVVVLAGSRRHVLGERPAAEDSNLLAHSATPNIMAVIAEHISGNSQLRQRWRYLRELDPRTAASEEVAAAHDPPEVGLREAARIMLRGPMQQLEFLAVPLIQGQVEEVARWDGIFGDFVNDIFHAVLATPIYVAIAGPRALRTGGSA